MNDDSSYALEEAFEPDPDWSKEQIKEKAKAFRKQISQKIKLQKKEQRKVEKQQIKMDKTAARLAAQAEKNLLLQALIKKGSEI